MKNVFIFDIDGCIMSDLFKNFSFPPKSEEERRFIIKDVNEKGRNVQLYPNFLRYYANNCMDGENNVFFVTGRKRKDFSILTEKQLSVLNCFYKPFDVIYYPEEKEHNKLEYYTWKITKIFELTNKQEDCYIIFDDLTEHFIILFDYATLFNLNFECHEVKSNDDWKNLI
jgi:hypothetical protein